MIRALIDYIKSRLTPAELGTKEACSQGRHDWYYGEPYNVECHTFSHAYLLTGDRQLYRTNELRQVRMCRRDGCGRVETVRVTQ